LETATPVLNLLLKLLQDWSQQRPELKDVYAIILCENFLILKGFLKLFVPILLLQLASKKSF